MERMLPIGRQGEQPLLSAAMKPIDLLQGTLDLLILRVLSRGEMHVDANGRFIRQ